MTAPNRVAIVGLGLIGASLARALRAAPAAPRVLGWDADAASLHTAVERGYIDTAVDSVEAAAREADLLIVATPVRSIAGIAARALAADSKVIVSDTGSVKQAVLSALEGEGGDLRRFVAGHPVAGSERFGVDAADDTLFAGRRVVLTPTETTTETALAVVRATWEAAGARVECMSPDHHDEVLAATSHLPHVLAYALVDCLAGMEGNRELFAYAAGGFRDFTRIASSSPEMWRDILMENRAALEPTLEAFETTLSAMRVALRSGDEASVLATLQRARTARERFLNLMDAPDAR
jgi:prephenate dehydrogenase